MSTTAASTEQILEDQLRSDCYALHASRSEVAELQSRHRDVECRYEYLRTVLNNMQRSEDNLKRTLAYETATSDAVINAARRGEPLPPALAADAATSVLCPPVHLAGKDSQKNLFQTANEIAQRREEETKQLEKEILDMETVIAAEKRSIGTLQHAMYAQAAWGDSMVKKRRQSNRTRAELLQDIEDAQKKTQGMSVEEQALQNKIESQKAEMAVKLRRLQEVEDTTRLLTLQIEEVKSAVVTGKRDLVRAQTLDAECGQVARIASDKITDINQRKKSGVASMLSRLGGRSGNNNNNSKSSSTTNVALGVPSYPPQHGGQIGDGTHRYDREQSSRITAESPIQFTAMNYNSNNFRKLPSHQQQSSNFSNANDEINFTAAPRTHQQQSGVAGLNQTNANNNNNNNNNSNPAGTVFEQRQAQSAQSFQDARADTNEWLRRYVGSMRGLHLTALETQPAHNMQ